MTFYGKFMLLIFCLALIYTLRKIALSNDFSAKKAKEKVKTLKKNIKNFIEKVKGHLNGKSKKTK